MTHLHSRVPERQFQIIEHEWVDPEDWVRFPYPWKGLEGHVESNLGGALPFLGYGSLLNSASASLTISGATRVPAIAFGVKRVFDYLIPAGHERYGPPVDPISRAALNVRITGRARDTVNGVFVEIPMDQIPALRDREVGYDLVAVPCVTWDDPSISPFPVYILRCPDDQTERDSKTRPDLRPHQQYYQVCRAGAQEFGDEFLQYWLDSTHLGDGETLVRDWESRELTDAENH